MLEINSTRGIQGTNVSSSSPVKNDGFSDILFKEVSKTSPSANVAPEKSFLGNLNEVVNSFLAGTPNLEPLGPKPDTQLSRNPIAISKEV